MVRRETTTFDRARLVGRLLNMSFFVIRTGPSRSATGKLRVLDQPSDHWAYRFPRRSQVQESVCPVVSGLHPETGLALR